MYADSGRTIGHCNAPHPYYVYIFLFIWRSQFYCAFMNKVRNVTYLLLIKSPIHNLFKSVGFDTFIRMWSNRTTIRGRSILLSNRKRNRSDACFFFIKIYFDVLLFTSVPSVLHYSSTATPTPGVCHGKEFVGTFGNR